MNDESDMARRNKVFKLKVQNKFERTQKIETSITN